MSIDKESTYYDEGGIETIDVIRAKLTDEQFKGYLLGNIIKYSCRVNFKHKDWQGQSRDVDKIRHYSGVLGDEITRPKHEDADDLAHIKKDKADWLSPIPQFYRVWSDPTSNEYRIRDDRGNLVDTHFTYGEAVSACAEMNAGLNVE